MLLPGFVQYRSWHSCAIADSLFVYRLCQRPPDASIYSSSDTTAARKKSLYILSDRSDFHMTDNPSITVHANRVLISFSVDEMLASEIVELIHKSGIY